MNKNLLFSIARPYFFEVSAIITIVATTVYKRV